MKNLHALLFLLGIALCNIANALAQQPVENHYTVYFDFGKSILRPEDRKLILQEITVPDSDVINIYLDGYADSVGTNADNYALSNNRCATIKALLQSMGYSPDKIISNYYGETRFKGPLRRYDITPDRRVDITVKSRHCMYHAEDDRDTVIETGDFKITIPKRTFYPCGTNAAVKRATVIRNTFDLKKEGIKFKRADGKRFVTDVALVIEFNDELEGSKMPGCFVEVEVKAKRSYHHPDTYVDVISRVTSGNPGLGGGFEALHMAPEVTPTGYKFRIPCKYLHAQLYVMPDYTYPECDCIDPFLHNYMPLPQFDSINTFNDNEYGCWVVHTPDNYFNADFFTKIANTSTGTGKDSIQLFRLKRDCDFDSLVQMDMLSNFEGGLFKMGGVFRLGKKEAAGMALADTLIVYAYGAEFSRQYNTYHSNGDSPRDINVYYYDAAKSEWIATGTAPRISDTSECAYFKFNVARLGYYRLGFNDDKSIVVQENRTDVIFKSRFIRLGHFFITDRQNETNETLDAKGLKKFSHDIDMRTKGNTYVSGSYTKNNITYYLHLSLDKMKQRGGKYIIRQRDFTE